MKLPHELWLWKRNQDAKLDMIYTKCFLPSLPVLVVCLTNNLNQQQIQVPKPMCKKALACLSRLMAQRFVIPGDDGFELCDVQFQHLINLHQIYCKEEVRCVVGINHL